MSVGERRLHRLKIGAGLAQTIAEGPELLPEEAKGRG
jgi:hypothetical protein